MERVAKFEKVSYTQFANDWHDCFSYTSEDEIKRIYESIELPRRATIGSAGYDFFSPISFTIKPRESIKLPTGIRTKIVSGWVLQCFPRSSLGFKFRLQFNNTVGIIDSDYYNSENEGHIFCKMMNDSNEEKTVTLNQGVGFMQGIFLPYGITEDDQVNQIRNGGLGSTTKR